MSPEAACWLLLGLGGFTVQVGVAVNIRRALEIIREVRLRGRA